MLYCKLDHALLRPSSSLTEERMVSQPPPHTRPCLSAHINVPVVRFMGQYINCRMVAGSKGEVEICIDLSRINLLLHSLSSLGTRRGGGMERGARSKLSEICENSFILHVCFSFFVFWNI